MGILAGFYLGWLGLAWLCASGRPTPAPEDAYNALPLVLTLPFSGAIAQVWIVGLMLGTMELHRAARDQGSAVVGIVLCLVAIIATGASLQSVGSGLGTYALAILIGVAIWSGVATFVLGRRAQPPSSERS